MNDLQEQLSFLLHEALKEELSSCVGYLYHNRLLSNSDNFTQYLSEELLEHADEEYEHYKEILDLTKSLNLPIEIPSMNEVFFQLKNYDDETVIQFNLDKERDAVDRYNAILSLVSKTSYEGAELVKKVILPIRNKEMEHVEDLENIRSNYEKSAKGLDTPKDESFISCFLEDTHSCSITGTFTTCNADCKNCDIYINSFIRK